MAKVEQKQTVVEQIKENIEGAQSIVLVDYRGLTVEQDTELRKSLREAGVTYKVYKNTMMRFAFEGTEFEPLSEELAGPSAIAISKEDATAPARVLNDIAKKYESLEFKAGVVDGKYYNVDDIKKIASIPSKEVLLGKLLGSIQSPITNMARVLNQIAEQNGSEEAVTE
ncbi:LSU ribosomal protein L10P [Natranaerovirga hydrolytica]|uniref:Large ribosomal subunit protein uL10 n=1 Tax=Natranaerovirga hydrolytica TaxID=680378 RepID=A0A4V2Q0D6_9FIRM|nr:50S ribosomal protein L10 [Natranaerovirga hydrolytica]TCK93401.1 LSU ribosomal protein L10P [Natranaerovirga hydrolytica]